MGESWSRALALLLCSMTGVTRRGIARAASHGKWHRYPKKSATLWGCAKVPPKEEDLEECADALGEHRHEFIIRP